jgi:ubiquinone biosynthesis protein COQ9
MSSLRLRILDASLAFVPSLGFTQAALVAGAESLSLSPAAAGAAAPRPGTSAPAALVLHWLEGANTELVTELRGLDKTGLDARGVLAVGLSGRVRQWGAVGGERWAAGLGEVVKDPFHARASFHQHTGLVSALWGCAGDRSTDLRWYTRRASLSAVYGATELFFVQDKSPANEATLAFLKDRLAQVDGLDLLHSRLKEDVSLMAAAWSNVIMAKLNNR